MIGMETVKEEAESGVEIKAGTGTEKEVVPETGNGAVEAETETGEIEEVNIGLEIGRIAGPRGAAGLEIDEDLHGGQDPGTDLGREELRQGWDLHHAVTEAVYVVQYLPSGILAT